MIRQWETLQQRFRFAMVLGLVLLSGCAPVVSSQLRDETRKDLTFAEALHNPTAYTGSIVIWGGIIIAVANRAEGTTLAVLETQLGYRERPKESETSEGRFLATTSRFLDPAVFSRGRKVTVAGEIIGKKMMALGKSKVSYTYPLVRIKQIYLWSIEQAYVSPPDYWWYGYGGFWPDEGFEDERFGNDMEHEERGKQGRDQEQGERR